MTPPEAAPGSAATPPALHARAMEQLVFIRGAMERAGAFTAVSGKGQMIVGGVGLAAAVLASRQTTPEAWLAVWLSAAGLGAGIAAVANARKARRLRVALLAGPGRRFWLAFLLPLAVGAVLTVPLYRQALFGLLPGVWLLLFGTGVVTGGLFAPRTVPVMGIGFIAMGAAALFTHPAWGDLWMAGGFGGLLIGFGFVIARRHGG